MPLSDDDKAWILAQLERSCDRVRELFLIEFHKWATPVETRQRSIAAGLQAVGEELRAISERVRELEGEAD